MFGTTEAITVYHDEETYNEAIEGVTYDKNTNTLILNNVDTDMVLSTNEMGKDFKIKLVGENNISGIVIEEGNLTIVGDGSLTVEAQEEGWTAVAFGISSPEQHTTPTLVVEKTAEVKLKASDYVIGIFYTPNNDWREEIVLENGQDLSSNVRTTQYSHEEQVYIFGLHVDSSVAGRTCNIYTKDNKMFGVEHRGDQYHLYNSPVGYIDSLDSYFFDTSTGNEYGTFVSYESEEEITADGYIKTENEVTIYHGARWGHVDLVKDNDGNEFVYGMSYLSDGTLAYKLYAVTNDEITLLDGKTYKIINYYDTIGKDEFEEGFENVYEKVEEGRYNIFVDLQELNIPAGTVVEDPVEDPIEDPVVNPIEEPKDNTENTEEKVDNSSKDDGKVTNNPATGDNIGIYFVVLAFSTVLAGITIVAMKKSKK